MMNNSEDSTPDHRKRIPPVGVEQGGTAPQKEPAPKHDGYVATSGYAIASLTLGILGFILLPVIGSILAVVFGILGLRRIKRSNGQVTGRGLAKAGLWLGFVPLAGGLLAVCVIYGMRLTGYVELKSASAKAYSAAAVKAPSGSLAISSSQAPAPTPTPAVTQGASEASVANQLNTLLAQSAQGRKISVNTVAQLANCSITPQQAEQEFNQTISIRQQVESQLQTLAQSGYLGTVIQTAESAMNISITANTDYLSWAEDMDASGCTTNSGDTNYTAGNTASDQATTIKATLAGQWLPFAKEYNLTQWSGDQI